MEREPTEAYVYQPDPKPPHDVDPNGRVILDHLVITERLVADLQVEVGDLAADLERSRLCRLICR